MIGIFNDNFPPVLDGVALTAKNYADWFSRRGEQVAVITPYAPDMPQTPYPIYTYQSVPLLMRKPYRLGLPQIDYAFHSRLQKIPFRLVHAHCPFTSGSLALKTAQKLNIPLVATFHSKYRQDFERAIPSAYIVDTVIKHIIAFYEKAYEVWIPQASVEPTLREYGYKGRVTVVENGNDLLTTDQQLAAIRRQMRDILHIGANETMFLYVGQHIWEKNIGFSLDALAKIKEQPFKMYMIGTGYAVEGIRHKIRDLQLEDKVVMVGVIRDRELLKRYYAAADLFLFPSLYDTDGIVIHEAAALQTPSVLLSGSTASTNISDRKTGFLTPNNADAYAQLLKYCINHPDELRAVGLRASRTIARPWEDVAREVLERYKVICERYKREH